MKKRWTQLDSCFLLLECVMILLFCSSVCISHSHDDLYVWTNQISSAGCGKIAKRTPRFVTLSIVSIVETYSSSYCSRAGTNLCVPFHPHLNTHYYGFKFPKLYHKRECTNETNILVCIGYERYLSQYTDTKIALFAIICKHVTESEIKYTRLTNYYIA